MSIKGRAARAVIRRHRLVRPLLPRGYHAYPAPGGWIYLDVRESPMMLARVLRDYERPKVATLKAILRPGDVFVDVGGNKGDFALLAAKVMGDRGRVICVEPEPGNVAWIERSIGRNRYQCIEVAPVALDASAGSATLHLGANSGWHSLVDERGAVGARVVPTQTLDGLLEERGVDHVTAIKIDVEGAEDRVLDGATRTLGGAAALTLLLDVHPGRGVAPVAVARRLEAWGFTLQDVVGPTTRSLVATR